jgi:hypothetical protein
MENPYILYNENGSDYILQKKFPHYIGRVSDKLERSIAQYPIAGHNMYVSFAGTLNGNFIQMDKFAMQDAQEAMSSMSSFLCEKIDELKYEKYKI